MLSVSVSSTITGNVFASTGKCSRARAGSVSLGSSTREQKSSRGKVTTTGCRLPGSNNFGTMKMNYPCPNRERLCPWLFLVAWRLSVVYGR